MEFSALDFIVPKEELSFKNDSFALVAPRFDAGDIPLNSRRLRGSFIHRPKQAAKKRLNPSKASPAARSPES